MDKPKTKKELDAWLDDLMSYVDNEDNPNQETAVNIDPEEMWANLIQSSEKVSTEKIKTPKPPDRS